MDARSIIEKALNCYLVYVQTDGQFYGEGRKALIEVCISHLQKGGVVSKEWLDKHPIINEALRLYQQTLKDEFQSTAAYTEEYRIVNKLIQLIETT